MCGKFPIKYTFNNSQEKKLHIFHRLSACKMDDDDMAVSRVGWNKGV